MADGIAGGPATPAMRLQDNNSILSNFLHWVFVGNRPGAGLDAVPGQFFSSINPTNKAGLLNLAAMFAGGGREGGDIIGPNVKGADLVPYRIGRAQEGGHIVMSEGSRFGQGQGRAPYAAEGIQQLMQDAQGRFQHRATGITPPREIAPKSPVISSESGHNEAGIMFNLSPVEWSRILSRTRANNQGGIPDAFPTEYLPNFHDSSFGPGFHHEPDPSLPHQYRQFVDAKLAKSQGHYENYLAAHDAAHERAAAGAEHHFFSGAHGLTDKEAALTRLAQMHAARDSTQGRFRDQISNNNFFRNNNHEVYGTAAHPQNPEAARAEVANNVRHNDAHLMQQIHGSYFEQMQHLMEHPFQALLNPSAKRQDALAQILRQRLGHNHRN